jgi:hypothetical protein
MVSTRSTKRRSRSPATATTPVPEPPAKRIARTRKKPRDKPLRSPFKNVKTVLLDIGKQSLWGPVTFNGYK